MNLRFLPLLALLLLAGCNEEIEESQTTVPSPSAQPAHEPAPSPPSLRQGILRDGMGISGIEGYAQGGVIVNGIGFFSTSDHSWGPNWPEHTTAEGWNAEQRKKDP